MKVATKRRVTGRRVRGPAKAREGVGSVEVLPSGRFRVRVWVEGQKKGDTFATREEAEQQRATLAVMHRATAQALPPEPKALTLAAWGKTWLERREELGEVRHPQGDRTRWDLHIGGCELAGMALADIRPKHITSWIDATTKRRKAKGAPGRVSPQTVRRAFALLRLALADAVRAEHIEANPAAGAKLPKAKAAPWAFLAAEEVAAVVRGAPGVPEESRRAFVVAIFTGLRQGELIALRWGDVTLDGPRPELHVQRSHDGPPKNGKPRRVPLLPHALEALQGLRREAGDVAPEALVFPTLRGHQRHRGNDFGWSVKITRGQPGPGYRLKLGITRYVRFHDLRHTCASHLAMGTWTSSPWPLQDVARWLGHGSVAITERYAHLAPGYLHDRAHAPVVASPERGTEAPRGTAPFVPRIGGNAGNTGRNTRPLSAPRVRDETLENTVFPSSVGQAWDSGALRARAMELLRAVDDGSPAGELARALALDVLRSAAPDSAPWSRAVAILEGGPLRMRHAVELAGLVMEAAEVTGEGMTG